MKKIQSQGKSRNVKNNTTYQRSGAGRPTASSRMSRDEMRRAQAEIRLKKKRRQQRLFYSILLLIIISVGVILSLTVFFHIEKITVEGESIYSHEQIIDSSSIDLNENLLAINSKSVCKKMEKNLPYIENVTIVKKLPATVIIKVESITSEYAVLANDGYTIISEKGKVLQKQVQELPENVATILGTEIKNAEVGESIELIDVKDFDLLNKLIQGSQNAGIKDITNIDITDELQITMLYQNRIRIEVGSISKYDNKMKIAAKALEDQDKNNSIQMGVLDLRNDSGAVFNREDIFAQETTENSTTEPIEETVVNESTTGENS